MQPTGRKLVITQEAFEDQVVTREWLETQLRCFNPNEKLDLEIDTIHGSIVSIALVARRDK